jgi:hypothetical protein
MIAISLSVEDVGEVLDGSVSAHEKIGGWISTSPAEQLTHHRSQLCGVTRR